MQIDQEKTYRANLETDKGTIVLELYPEHAPATVNNFVISNFLTLPRLSAWDSSFTDNSLSIRRCIRTYVVSRGFTTGNGGYGLPCR